MQLIHFTSIRYLLSDGLIEHPHLSPERTEEAQLRQSRQMCPKSDCKAKSFIGFNSSSRAAGYTDIWVHSTSEHFSMGTRVSFASCMKLNDSNSKETTFPLLPSELSQYSTK